MHTVRHFRCIDGHCDVTIGGPGKKCMSMGKELSYTKTFGKSSPQLTLNGSVNIDNGVQLGECGNHRNREMIIGGFGTRGKRF